MLALLVTIAAAAWQDETYGPQMRQYALIAMEKFEEATDEGSAGRKLVQTAISKLEL
ncbi:hypothetical protein [Roseovarius aestuarii]|nr:hypothetical protein [Roseovarius aestuarii]